MSEKRSTRALHLSPDLRDATVIDPTITGGTISATTTITTAGGAQTVPVTFTPDSGTITVGDSQVPLVGYIQITLTATPISIAAANDYGGILLGTFDNNHVPISTHGNVTFTHTGLTGDATSVTLGVGTAVASDVALTNSGGSDIVFPSAATGTTTGSWLNKQEQFPALDLDPTSLYLNAASAVPSGTGVLTVTGTICIVTIQHASTLA